MFEYKEDAQILTVACKLVTTPEQAQDFENLSLIFAATCNYIKENGEESHSL